MKTSRQITAEIEQYHRALESWQNAQEEELVRAVADDAALKARIMADDPHVAARRQIAAQHQPVVIGRGIGQPIH